MSKTKMLSAAKSEKNDERYTRLAVSSNGSFYFPTYDNNGNITKYIDESGNIIASYEYDDFGRLISQTGPLADFFRIRFSTKYLDAETDLYYYGCRFYSPVLMRWLNRDPIEEEGGMNLYGFVRNAPLYCCDYSGTRVIISRNSRPKRVPDIAYATKAAVRRPRAITIKRGNPRFYCDKSCRLRIDGNITLSIEMLNSDNPRWHEQYPRYKTNPLVNPELMAYSHELDHYDTWSAYLDVLEQVNKYDGKHYPNCNDVVHKFQGKHDLLLTLVQLHSKDFDTDGLNQGLRYLDTPFYTSWFSWE